MTFRHYKLLGFAAFFLLLAALPVAAQVPDLKPLNHETLYKIYWNGFKFGRIRITTSESALSYHILYDLEVNAIPPFVTKQTNICIVDGVIRDGKYIPTKYDSVSNNGLHSVITYDPDGHILTRVHQPPEDPTWRPVVPLDEANTATDPLTAFFTLRKELHTDIVEAQRDATVRTYDGARLADMNFKLISPANEKIMGADRKAINIVASRKPIDGYTPKEKAKYDKGDPTVHLYFSADEEFMPIKAEMELFPGTLEADLVEIK